MKYQFRSPNGSIFEIEAPIAEGPPKIVYCPETGLEAQRIFNPTQDVWNTDGAHRHTYDAKGDKLERLNKQWSKHYGEKPPEPAKDVPRNSSELH